MGTAIEHDRIRELLNSLSEEDNGHYRVVPYLDERGAWLKTLSNDHLYVLVQATLPDQGAPDRTFVLVHAGGAHGAAVHPGLFQHLCTQAWRFDYGGPWSTVTVDGTVAYGWRLLLPSDLLCEENLSDFFGFVFGMVDNVGSVARALGSELVPAYGGKLFHDADPDAFRNLLAGVVPPA